ncbi:carbohydrate ABC transporter permease [Phytoactinopolyspora endophytica]|uniref:carbohydrate ABC transporter permease n=1 Tax=Phytoactinopolyspora endophytica TaxID=1642495 RepID=UPI00197B120D|nr:carbohydrate ABC transporter permease [Phytoactinopolyspora endophytica]
MTSVVLAGVGFLWMYPFLWMIASSLKTNREIFGSFDLIPDAPQWENYSRAWEEAHIGQYFWNSVIISAGTVAIVVITTSMLGYALGRYTFVGRKFIYGALIATVFLPEGYTVIPVFDLVNRLGLSGNLLGVILAEAGGANVITILLFAGYFQRLPRELDEAATVDGAGFFRTFWQIMLPLAKPAIATAIILTLMRTWNSFLIPLVLTLAQPDLRPLSVGIYSFRGDDYSDWSGMTAAATLSTLPIIVVFLVLQRYFVEGLAGAVKN